MAGLASAVLASESTSVDTPASGARTHHRPTAKRIIFLCMQGGPSHVDSFDHKPDLARDAGKSGRFGGRLLASPWTFRPRGQSGLQISDLFPQVANHADDLCLIRSMQCDQPIHTAALTQMHTGTANFIRPSLGSWLLYGLGTENESVPGYIHMAPPAGASRNHGSAFLPAEHAGSAIGASGRAAEFFGGDESLPDLEPTLPKSLQRRQLNFVQSLNKRSAENSGAVADFEGVIASYEQAFRMQSAMPELMDLDDESEATRRLYGVDEATTRTFGRQCLTARRLIESGVRFVEITHGNWDQHFRLQSDHAARAEACDRPIAGLLEDLKRRDLLKDTLVIWGGEFGRTPAAQGSDGRNHNHRGYTTWMAGGGVRGGHSHGATDDHGYEAVEDVCHVHDWHATILHALGLDHTRLTYRYAGRDYRLTDVHGNVHHGIFA